MPLPPRTERRRPRTQAQRRAETREALLDATVECLVEFGYSGTTTGRIAELAGVSRGAQTPYFRSRVELVVAAFEHVAEQRIAAFHERVGGRTITVEEGLDAIWEACEGPVFLASLELWVASRTDPELRASLPKVERRVAAALAVEALDAVGPRAQREGFTEDLMFALAAIRGLALLRISNGESGRVMAERWLRMRARLVEILA